MNEEDYAPYVYPVTLRRGYARTFVSYSPTTYTYKYDDPQFKIGMTRVDNRNNSTPASLNFEVTQSSHCDVEASLSVEYGGEVEAIFAKAEVKYGAEVSERVSWTRGTSVGTGVTVPAGKVGTITAYVIGIYSSGTVTYRVLNTTTGDYWDEKVGAGALIPTTNSWNFIPVISNS